MRKQRTEYIYTYNANLLILDFTCSFAVYKILFLQKFLTFKTTKYILVKWEI